MQDITGPLLQPLGMGTLETVAKGTAYRERERGRERGREREKEGWTGWLKKTNSRGTSR